MDKIGALLKDNAYPGRGIITGMSADGKSAVAAYFIMGRSANSRNRVFAAEGEDLKTKAFDESKVEDPSLIIYYPVRTLQNNLIVTNGDQTDTIFDFLSQGKTMEDALATRCFEPDAPLFTPRISALLTFADGTFSYKMSILKAADAAGAHCARQYFCYEAAAGEGQFIHTYQCDGNPPPSFAGEPEPVEIPNDVDAFTKEIWENLHEDNKISLFVRYIDLASGEAQTRVLNKNV
ncbi:hypothetical protein IMSAG013_00296 [Clostridiales bacterium]|nr:inosine monophosphate cyclohydrolase [Clostridiales bacterium]GFI55254.1 hypothetical protein IMSAG013_00296 [Clostridiales bacterium]